MAARIQGADEGEEKRERRGEKWRMKEGVRLDLGYIFIGYERERGGGRVIVSSSHA